MAISAIATTAASAAKKGPGCTVCLALDQLPEADSAGLLALLKNPSWRYTEIAERISADEDTPEWVRGIHHSTYARHASGSCSARTRLR